MIHSASLRATGSPIAASACVASACFPRRTRSMTFCNAPRSAREVDDVAATTDGRVGLDSTRGGGRCAAGDNARGAEWDLAEWDFEVAGFDADFAGVVFAACDLVPCDLPPCDLALCALPAAFASGFLALCDFAFADDFDAVAFAAVVFAAWCFGVAASGAALPISFHRHADARAYVITASFARIDPGARAGKLLLIARTEHQMC